MKKVLFLLLMVLFACKTEVNNSSNMMFTECYIKGDVISVKSMTTSPKDVGKAIVEEAEFENGLIKTINYYIPESSILEVKSKNYIYKDGKIAEIKTFSDGKEAFCEKYIYEGDKILIESDGNKIVADINGYEFNGYNYVYENGYIKEIINKDEKVVISRNKKNDITEIQGGYVQSAITERVRPMKGTLCTCRYEYDINGNWTKQDLFINGKLEITTTREILYK